MTMRIIRNIIKAVGVTLLTACATNENKDFLSWNQNSKDDLGQLITLTASGSSLASAITRAETDIQTSLFDADEVLQGYITHNTSPSVNFSPLMTAMPAENGRNPLKTNQQLYWPVDPTKSISLYAIYPSTATGSQFTVEADQTSDDAYKASDLMWASRNNVKYADTNEQPLNLEFTHKLAKLIVNASTDGSVPGVVVKNITIKNIDRTIGFTPETGALGSLSGTSDDDAKNYVLMSNNGACLLPPQPITAGVDFVIVAVTINNQDYNAVYKAGPELSSLMGGYQYVLDVKIGSQSLKQTSTIADWTAVTPGHVHVIEPKEWGSLVIDDIAGTYQYNGSFHEPVDKVFVHTIDGISLTKDEDYTLEFLNNKDAGTALAIATGKSGTDYVGQVALQKFLIGKLPLTLTANNQTITYGEQIPNLEGAYTSSGWLAGESNIAPYMTNQPDISTTATSASDAGTYPITPSGAIAKNYEISYVEGTLTINKKPVNWSLTSSSLSWSGTEDKNSDNKSKSFSVNGYEGDGTLTVSVNNASPSGCVTAVIDGYTVTVTRMDDAGGSANVVVSSTASTTNYSYSPTSQTCSISLASCEPATLQELKAWINNGNTNTKFFGYYVSSTGAISKTKPSGAVGIVGYYKDKNTDVDASCSGSRILVMSVEDAGKYKAFGSQWNVPSLNPANEQPNTDSYNQYPGQIAAMTNGYQLTSNNQSDDFPALKAAWNYSTNLDNIAGKSSWTHWFLPSYQQIQNMASSAISTGRLSQYVGDPPGVSLRSSSYYKSNDPMTYYKYRFIRYKYNSSSLNSENIQTDYAERVMPCFAY